MEINEADTTDRHRARCAGQSGGDCSTSRVVSKQRSPGGNAVTMLWVTGETPVDMSASSDRAETKVGVPPPANGSIFRIVDFPPTAAGAPPVDHHEMLVGMGIDPATQGYSRHPNTHRTRSIDYAIVLEGEIDMLMDDTEVHMKAGDVLVQQGTNHAWVNNGDQALPHRVHPDRREGASGLETGLDQMTTARLSPSEASRRTRGRSEDPCISFSA